MAIAKFPDRRRGDTPLRQEQGADADGGGPPYDGDMEARVAALEKDMKDVRERVIKIEAKLDGFPALFASKSDVSEAKVQIILWVVGAIFIAQILPQLPAILRAFGVKI